MINHKLLSRTHVIPGLMSDDACDALAELASNVSPGQAIVEIGVYKGKSLAALAVGALDAGVYVIGVDVFDTDAKTQGKHTVPMTHATASIEALELDHLVTIRCARSVSVARSWKGSSVRLLHIDGNHRYESVLSDIDAWYPHLTEDAVIVFDDYNREQAGVKRAVNERFGRPDEILVERLAIVRIGR